MLTILQLVLQAIQALEASLNLVERVRDGRITREEALQNLRIPANAIVGEDDVHANTQNSVRALSVEQLTHMSEDLQEAIAQLARALGSQDQDHLKSALSNGHRILESSRSRIRDASTISSRSRRARWSYLILAMILAVAAITVGVRLFRTQVQAGGSGTLVEGVIKPLGGTLPSPIRGQDLGSNEAPFHMVQGQIDLGLRSAKLWPDAVQGEAYEGWVFVGICIGRDTPAWYVHFENPLQSLSMSRLREILFCPEGQEAALATWRSLGVPPDNRISSNRVRVIVPGRQSAGIESGTVSTMKRILGVPEEARFCYPVEKRSIIWLHKVPDLVRGDPNSIGLSSGVFANSRVRPLKLTDSSGREIDLARGLWLYVAFTDSKQPPDEVVRMVEWFLSDSGQQALSEKTHALPLSAEERGAQDAWFRDLWSDVRKHGPETVKALSEATGGASIRHCGGIEAR